MLRCPVCGDDLDARPKRACTVCETPAHQECLEYIGGCARFACQEAATPRRRVNEYLALQLERAYFWTRGRAIGFVTWTAANVVVGLGKLIMFGHFNGFILLPWLLLWVLGVRVPYGPLEMGAVALAGFLLPAWLGLAAMDRAFALKGMRAWLAGHSATPLQQRELLQTFAPGPGRKRVPALLGPAVRVVAVLAGIAALKLLVRYWQMKDYRGPDFSPGLLVLYGAGFGAAAAALWWMGGSVAMTRSRSAQAERLAEMWRAELETLVEAKELADKVVVIDGVAASMSPEKLRARLAQEASETAARLAGARAASDGSAAGGPAPAAPLPAQRLHGLVPALPALAIGALALIVALQVTGTDRTLKLRLGRFFGFDTRPSVFGRSTLKYRGEEAWVVTPVLPSRKESHGILASRVLAMQISAGLMLAGKTSLEPDALAHSVERERCFRTGARPSLDELEDISSATGAMHVIVPFAGGVERFDHSRDFDLLGGEVLVAGALSESTAAQVLAKIGSKLPEASKDPVRFPPAVPGALELLSRVKQRAAELGRGAPAEAWAQQGVDLALLGRFMLRAGSRTGFVLMEKGIALSGLALLGADTRGTRLYHALALAASGQHDAGAEVLEPLVKQGDADAQALKAACRGDPAGVGDPSARGLLYRLALEGDGSLVSAGNAKLEEAARSMPAEMLLVGLVEQMGDGHARYWMARWVAEAYGPGVMAPDDAFTTAGLARLAGAISKKADALGVDAAVRWISRHHTPFVPGVPVELEPNVRQVILEHAARAYTKRMLAARPDMDQHDSTYMQSVWRRLPLALMGGATGGPWDWKPEAH